MVPLGNLELQSYTLELQPYETVMQSRPIVKLH
jgi:hypothetical protein